MQKGRVTLPRYQEVKYRHPILSDYAIATGARCYPLQAKFCYGKRLQSGATWVCDDAGEKNMQFAATCEQGGKLGYQYAGDRTIAVMPRIENAKALGFDIGFQQGESVLLYHDQVVRYPFYNISGKRSEQLFKALRTQDRLLREVGECISDGAPMVSSRDGYNWEEFRRMATVPFQQQINRHFTYQGEDYVLVEQARQFDKNSIFHNNTPCVAGQGYWFSYEPVRAAWCEDGAIQCDDLLVTCQYERQDAYEKRKRSRAARVVDTDELAIGAYLNGDLLRDFIKSTEPARVQSYRKLQTFCPELDESNLKIMPSRHWRKERLREVIGRDLQKCPDRGWDY